MMRLLPSLLLSLTLLGGHALAQSPPSSEAPAPPEKSAAEPSEESTAEPSAPEGDGLPEPARVPELVPELEPEEPAREARDAEEQHEGEPADDTEEEGEGWDPLKIDPDDSWYVRLIKTEIARVGDMDLYGNSAQLPRGYMSIKYDWTSATAGSRYGANGVRGPVINPVRAEVDGVELINADLGLTGEGGGHGFMVSYGIIDRADWFLEVPFTYLKLSLNPVLQEVDEEGNRIAPGVYAKALGIEDTKAYNAADFIYDTWPKLGRAVVATEYEADWLLGDIRTGVSWNYFRNARVSFALIPKISFPTGKVQDPNNSILYATGPAIETGLGGWAMGASHVMDLRLFNLPPWLDVIFTTELGVNYGFTQERAYPTNFEPPLEVATQIDPNTFPDLSDLEGTFEYTPGFSVDWMAQLSVGAPILSVGFAYGVQFSQTPWMEGDPDFIRMAKSLELVGQSEHHAIQVGVTTNLLALYVPIGLGFAYRKTVAGRNVIVLDDYWQFTVTGLIPVEPLVTFESEE